MQPLGGRPPLSRLTGDDLPETGSRLDRTTTHPHLLCILYMEGEVRSWLVKDARARFSDVIDGALAGEPQRVTRRGKGAVVVVSEEEWKRLAKPKTNTTLGEYLTTFPLSAEEWDEIAPKRRSPRRNPFSDLE